MKLRAVLASGRILRRLRGMDAAIREAALDAAAEALRNELTRAGGSAVSVEARGSPHTDEALSEWLSLRDQARACRVGR